MTLHLHDAYALINLALCLGIMWSCICRLNSDLCRHHIGPRARYTLLLAGASANGWQPLLFNEYPGIGTVLLSLSVATSLAISARWWPAPENTPPHFHPQSCENHHDHHDHH